MNSPYSVPPDSFVIIMAGGRGERFWPVSREKTPKQLIRLLNERSFLQDAVDRVSRLVPPQNIFVITNSAQAREVAKQLPALPKENVVAEPVGRDTCAAVALGAALVGARSTQATMAVLPADHVIPEPDKFERVLADSLNLAAQNPVIVTIGIPPTEPATGYGYIHVGEPFVSNAASEESSPTGSQHYSTDFYRAERFKEKPDLERAQEYLRSGQYRWNAGMFVWSFHTILDGLKQHQPGLAAQCEGWMRTAQKSPAQLKRVLTKEYPGLAKISIDYALLEKAENVVVADGSFAWDDLGAWPALDRHIAKDTQGNSVVGELVAVEATGNILFDGRTKNRTPIGLVGITDSIVVLTNDAILVAAKADAQKIKELVRQLAADPKYKHLV
jgi:mannose-1-phosphate guanylyltransferase